MTNEEELLPFCKCGCGLRVTKPKNRFIHGHHRRGKKNSPEHIAAMSRALTGLPKSPETCAKMSKASRNSNNVKEHNESMQGGNDIITHHYIYDESDLSKYTVKMTRSDHSSLHLLLQKLGYVTPHINIIWKNKGRIVLHKIKS